MSLPDRVRRRVRAVTADTWIVAAVIALFLLPLVTTRYFPGLDLPWHAATVAVLATPPDDVGREFLGFLTIDPRFSSYLTMYYAVEGLAVVTGDVAIAMQLLIAIYVVAFVLGVRRLLRAFGHAGVLAILAAPAAYSATLELGFLSYALAYPMTFYLWAVTRELVAGDAPPLGRGIAIAALSALLAITHPFAAALALAGAALIVIVQLSRGRRARVGIAIGAVAVGVVPAALAVASLSTDAAAPLPPLLARASWWDKLAAQPLTPIGESLARAPEWTFGLIARPLRLALLVAIAAAAITAARGCGRVPRPERGYFWARYPAELLAGALVAAYLITPFTFEWPRYWYGAQPRVLPLVLVAALLCVRARPRGGRPLRVFAAPVAVSVAAGVAVLVAMWPFARECRDFRRVVDVSARRATTLALVEHAPAADREVPEPWRHFGAYVIANRGGFTANLPFARPGSYVGAGSLVPVRLADDDRRPPVPAAPRPGEPRTFRWELHAAGWDQFLIRDLDPEHPHEYFGTHAGEVDLVVRSGRWRLYRRR